MVPEERQPESTVAAQPQAAGERDGAGGSAGAVGLAPEHAEAELATGEELDPERRARRDAALAQIRKLGDHVLRTRALPVERFDRALEEEIERMGELMIDALGVGLAANQVGVLHRVFVYRVEPEQPVRALVNPVVEPAGEELEAGEEGCLSIPGVHVEVERLARVRVRGQDASGRAVAFEAGDLEARVIQHELDHLDGVLILDRISRERRREAMRGLREAMQGASRRPGSEAVRTAGTRSAGGGSAGAAGAGAAGAAAGGDEAARAAGQV